MKAKLKEFEDLIKKETLKTEQKKIVTISTKSQSQTAADKSSVVGPDFGQLKKQSIQQQLIVREFFTANGLVVGGKKKKVSEADQSLVTIIDESNNDDDDTFGQNLIFRIKETNEEIVRILPTVDSKSQIKIRRNIFYEKLTRWYFFFLKPT